MRRVYLFSALIQYGLKSLFVAALLGFGLCGMAQSTHILRFIPTFNGLEISRLPYKFSASECDSLTITTCKFYIHNLQLLHKGSVVWREADHHFLCDAGERQSMNLVITTLDELMFDQLQYTIGVDSAVQVNGAQSGMLDPILGMYWTWQSGYIHFKLEADCVNGEKKEMLLWHIGGYRNPYNTIRTISVDVFPLLADWPIQLDLNKLLIQGVTTMEHTIMSPSKNAMHLADQFQNAFRWFAD